mgnify:CR=1 FL=1
MNIEEKIKNCEIYLKQIKKYDPDPYYVNHFFNEYIDSVNNTYDDIFKEANRDFGLFIEGKITQKKFNEKGIMKNFFMILILIDLKKRLKNIKRKKIR